MQTQGLRDWFSRRLAAADKLAADPTAVFDAEILLCCSMSALAAIAWPGDRKDRRAAKGAVGHPAATQSRFSASTSWRSCPSRP